jgi:hypothetical protein
MAVLYRDPGEPPAPATYLVPATPTHPPPSLEDEHAMWGGVRPIVWGPQPYRTAFRATWSPVALWVRFDCEDQAPWHTLARRDDPLWEEEVVEIFLDPAAGGRDYAEIEVSPGNVVCDLRVTSPWPDLSADRGWDLPGLDTRVRHVPRDEGAWPGWRVTACLPWDGLGTLSPDTARLVPPAAGDRWRFNVFRIKRPHGPAEPERDALYAAWSVPPGPSFHVPHAFGELAFVV